MAEAFLLLQHLKERIFFFFLTFSWKIFSSVILGDGFIIKWFLLFFPVGGCWRMSVCIFLFIYPFYFLLSFSLLSLFSLHFFTSSIFCFSPSIIWALSALFPCLFLKKSDKRKRLLVQQTAGRNLCLHFKVFGECCLCLVCFTKHNTRVQDHDESFLVLPPNYT